MITRHIVDTIIVLFLNKLILKNKFIIKRKLQLGMGISTFMD